jgi:hypothetical protein
MLSLLSNAPPGSRLLHETLASLHRLSAWLSLPARRITPLLLTVLKADPLAEELVQVRLGVERGGGRGRGWGGGPRDSAVGEVRARS